METTEMVPRLRFKEFNKPFETRLLSQVCTKIQDGNYGGSYPKSNEFLKDGIPFLTSKALGNSGKINPDKIDFISSSKHLELKKAQLALDDILFTNRGANVGVVAKVDESIQHGNIGPQLTLLRSNRKQISPLYLLYIMTHDSVKKQIYQQDSGSAMNFFGIKDTSKFRIKITSFKEQQKIASFLSSVDDKISQLEKKKTLLETYKMGIMQKIFSQELRFKDENGLEFPEWKNSLLGEECEIIGGGTPDSTNENYWGDEISWFTPTEIKQKYLKKSSRMITRDGLNKSSAKLLPKGSLLLTTRATIGDVAFCTSECSTNQGFQSFLPTSKPNLDFLYYWINGNKKELIKRSSGSTFLEISKKEIQKITIKLPNINEQQKIASFLSSIEKKIEITSTQLDKTREFKKGLLQQMFV